MTDYAERVAALLTAVRNEAQCLALTAAAEAAEQFAVEHHLHGDALAVALALRDGYAAAANRLSLEEPA